MSKKKRNKPKIKKEYKKNYYELEQEKTLLKNEENINNNVEEKINKIDKEIVNKKKLTKKRIHKTWAKKIKNIIIMILVFFMVLMMMFPNIFYYFT